MIYGHFVIRAQADDDDYEHRIEVHSPPDSGAFNKLEDGIYRKVDFDRFYVEWEPADEPG